MNTAKQTKPQKVDPQQVAKLLATIENSLEENKAENTVVIDLAGKSSLADFMVVTSGRSTTHVSSLSSYIERDLKKSKDPVLSVTGRGASDWVLIDAGDVIVHVFRPEVREFYRLEKMWQEDFDQIAED
jgi:ribosome-associated protein